jgi:hypothetical protein
LKNKGPRLILSKAYTIPLQINLTAWVYDPSVNQTAESYFMTKVDNSQKQSERKLDSSLKYHGANCSHQKHEEFNLVFTNHRTVDGIYPLKRDSKAQDKDQKIYCTTCMNTNKEFVFSTY